MRAWHLTKVINNKINTTTITKHLNKMIHQAQVFLMVSGKRQKLSMLRTQCKIVNY